MKKLFLLLILVGLGIGGYFLFGKKEKILSPEQFEFIQIGRGDIVEEVSSTGTLQPINVVTVGTQVSGIIEKIFADYNDEVTEGQILIELDKTLLNETLTEAQADLDLAQSKQKVAEMNFNRYKDLYKQKLIAKAEMEEAEIALASAETDVISAHASLNKAKKNLGYATITSPLSGTIISKDVEQGQTVAASFNTPTLFTIAEDMTLMQIEASIAEADIGKIKNGMKATFTVDAYPNDTFHGIVKQVRLNPETTDNVVMYTVIIEVNNESKKLLPGMTAFVTVITNTRENVLRLPNTTIQFKPNAFLRKNLVGPIPTGLKGDEAVVYTLEENGIRAHIVKLGLTNVTYSEVLNGINEGDKIISEFIEMRKGGGMRPRP